MKTLKLIRLISIIAALGILAAYTVVYIFQGEYQLFNWIILLSCLVLVPLLIITEFKNLVINMKFFSVLGSCYAEYLSLNVTASHRYFRAHKITNTNHIAHKQIRPVKNVLIDPLEYVMIF